MASQLIRVVADATCPGCGFPELGHLMEIGDDSTGLSLYYCTQDECNWASKERPEED